MSATARATTRFDEILADLIDRHGVDPLWQELQDVHRRELRHHAETMRAAAAAARAAAMVLQEAFDEIVLPDE